MTPSTLQALRRLLFFSAPEAAELIGGVAERSWPRWEDGTRAIPADVIERIEDLIEWRNSAINVESKTIMDRHIESDDEFDIALVWYQTLDDWLTLPGREPIMWRPQCSVVAELCATFGAIAVPFDAAAYKAWLGPRADSEQMRSEWAAQQ